MLMVTGDTNAGILSSSILSSGQGSHFILFVSLLKSVLVSSNENSDIFRNFLLTEIVKMRIGNGKIRKMENKTCDVAFAVSRI